LCLSHAARWNSRALRFLCLRHVSRPNIAFRCRRAAIPDGKTDENRRRENSGPDQCLPANSRWRFSRLRFTRSVGSRRRRQGALEPCQCIIWIDVDHFSVSTDLRACVNSTWYRREVALFKSLQTAARNLCLVRNLLEGQTTPDARAPQELTDRHIAGLSADGWRGRFIDRVFGMELGERSTLIAQGHDRGGAERCLFIATVHPPSPPIRKSLG
jgi:hypothetical protein